MAWRSRNVLAFNSNNHNTPSAAATSRRAGIAGDHAGEMFESLEQRTLLFAWTPQEVYLAELVNRARANPTAEGTRLGIDLTAGLSGPELARLVPQQPLALNQALTLASRAHSADMAARNFFDHVNPSGKNPTQRAQAAGYTGSVGENIGAGYGSVDEVHKAWLQSVGHRKNVLSLWSNFDTTFHYDEFGPSALMGIGGTYNNYFSEEFGSRSSNKSYLLGVIYADGNNNQFYNIGEGRTGVRVDVAFAGAPSVVVGTYTTDSAGNYQIDLSPGSYLITFTDTSTARTYSTSATITNQNVKVDARVSQFTLPVVSDDHADAGEWAQASVIAITSNGTAGTGIGKVNGAGDTDLFRFVAAGTGEATISLAATSQNWVQRIRVFNANGDELGEGVGQGFGTYAVVNFDVVAGATYFIVADAENGLSTGDYLAVYQGPETDTGGGGGGGGGGNSGVIAAIHRPTPGTSPQLGIDASGNVFTTYLSENNRPVFGIRAPDGSWDLTDLSTYFPNASYTGNVTTWTDKISGDLFVAVRANKGIIIFRRLDDGPGDPTWNPLNIVGRTTGSINIGSQLTVVADVKGYITITGLSKFGDLLTWTQLPQSTAAGNPRFVYRNVTGRDLPQAGMVIPDLSGQITAWTTPRNTLNIAAVGPSGEIRLFWKVPGQAWTGTNLSQEVGMTAQIAGNLTAFQTPGRGITIIGATSTGDSFAISWRTGFNWRYRGLSNLGAGPVDNTTFSSWVSLMGPVYVTAINEQGETVLFRYRNNPDSWNAASVTLDNAPALTGSSSSVLDRVTGVTYILSRNVGGELTLLKQEYSGEWSSMNLSSLLAA